MLFHTPNNIVIENESGKTNNRLQLRAKWIIHHPL
jgi:hypothetical protein